MPIDAGMNGHYWNSLKLIEDIYRIVRPLGLVIFESFPYTVALKDNQEKKNGAAVLEKSFCKNLSLELKFFDELF